MKVITDAGTFDLGTTEAQPTIGIVDYSRRETDDFGVTTVVKRDFARRLSVRMSLPTTDVDALQRRLAALRATAALWVADEGLACLSVEGFYKEFELDLAVPPLSYCSLTVEGLAVSETLTDDGSDPAPDGLPSTLRLLQPVSITDAMLASSNIAETDYPEWSAGTSYALGARVIKAALHKVYESAIAGNVGNDPAATSSKWLDVGATNRWAMFDEALGSVSTRASSIVVKLTPGAIDTLALLDVVGDTMRVEAAGYDQTRAASPAAAIFTGLPGMGLITVTISGATASVGTLMVGNMRGLGVTEAAPSAGITDYSRKEVDDFGDVTIVERAWAKRMTARSLIRTDAVDAVFSRVADVRARPALWIADGALDSLTIYGFFKDFSIEVGEIVSKLSLSIEGLSTAAPITPLTVAWPDITDPEGTKPDDNATVGAPPGTQIGGRPVEQVLVDLDAAKAELEALPSELAGQVSELRNDFDEQVGHLQDRAQQLENDADALSHSVDGLSDEVAATAYDVATISDLVESHGSSIETQGEAISGLTGSVATLSQKVKAGARNMLKNSSFENGLANWTVIAGTWAVVSDSNWGTYVETFSTTAPDGYVVLVSDYVPAEPGLPYTLAADMSFFGANPGGENYMEMQFTGADGFVVPGGYFSVFNPLGAGFSLDLDGRRRITATAPAGTVKVRVSLVGRFLSGSPHIAFRMLKIENGAFMSPFSQEASVTQTFKALSTMSTQYAALSETVETDGGRIDDVLEVVSDLDTDVATARTLIRAGSINLLKNSSFELGFANWYRFGSGSWINTLPDDGWGSYAINNTVSGTPSGIVCDEVNIIGAGYAYTASADMHFDTSSGTGSFALIIQWRDAGGGYLTQSAYAYKTPGIGFTNSRDARIRVTAISPPGAVRAQVYAYAQPISGTLSVAVRQVKLELGAEMSLWTQEASVFRQARGISTLDGQMASVEETLSIQSGDISDVKFIVEDPAGTLAQVSHTVDLQGARIHDVEQLFVGPNGSMFQLSHTVDLQGAHISDAEIAISGLDLQTASLTQKIRAGSPNFVKNSTFENGFDFWGLAGTWVIIADWQGRFAYTETAGFIQLDTDYMPAAAGVTYTASANLSYYGPTGNLRLRILWYGASGYISETASVAKPYGGFTDNLDGRVRITGIAPAGTTYARVSIFSSDVIGGYGGGSAVKEVKFERGAQMSPWTQEASVIRQAQVISSQDGQLSQIEEHLSAQGGDVSTLMGIVVSPTGTLAQLSSTVATDHGRIDVHQEAIETTNGQLANRYGIALESGTGIARLTGMTNNTTGGWLLEADETAIVDSDGNILAKFTKVAGGAYIPNLLVDRIKLGSVGSVGATITFGTTGPTYGAGFPPSTDFQALPSYNLTLAANATVTTILSLRHSYTAAADYGAFILIDGTTNRSESAAGTGATEASPCAPDTISLGPGSHTVEPFWRGSNGITLEKATVILIVTYDG